MPRAWVGKVGLKGFDCNVPLSPLDLKGFYSSGYRFVLRYAPRTKVASNDLTARELTRIYEYGIGVMLVQHVEPGIWFPDEGKGRLYGQVAGDFAHHTGLSLGSTVWLDLESVDKSSKPETVIRYCNYWHDRVALAGFQPGIYVGWQCGLTADQLYQRLKFTRYWSAYNLNRDQFPAVRGVCMKQGAGRSPEGIKFQIDTNVITGDALGGFPTLSVPDEWDPR